LALYQVLALALVWGLVLELRQRCGILCQRANRQMQTFSG
jgi:hypothetical protein